MSRMAKAIMGLAGCSATQAAMLAVLGLVLAKILTAEEFGATRAVTNYLLVLVMVGHFALHDAAASHVARESDPERRSFYVYTAMVLVLSISLFVVFVAEWIVINDSTMNGLLRGALEGSVPWVPLISVSLVCSSVMQAVGGIRELGIYLVLGGVVPLLVIPLFAWLAGLDGWVVGRGLAALILLVISVRMIRPWTRSAPSVAVMRIRATELLSFAKFQAMSGALSMGIQASDLIVLERIGSDLREIASYGMAALFAKSLAIFPNAVGRVFFADIAKEGPDMWRSIRQLFATTVAVSAGLALVCAIAVPFALKELYGDKYPEAERLLRIMLVGVVFSGLWAAFSTVNVALKAPRSALLISAVSSASCILSLLILVPRFGASGAAWAMNITYMCGVFTGAAALARRRMSDTVEIPR